MLTGQTKKEHYAEKEKNGIKLNTMAASFNQQNSPRVLVMKSKRSVCEFSWEACANAAESDKRDLVNELETTKHLRPHPHVIKLVGCVTASEPLLVLIEYVPYGDLLGYLRKSRGLNDTYYKDPDIEPNTNLTSQQLMKFSWQIADGMSYLSSKSIIHRDLAARNVLVGARETCKVTDFGMARDVQEENIYEKKSKVIKNSTSVLHRCGRADTSVVPLVQPLD
ncbi:Tyrosine kinase receptor Cad96Ca [Stylophora pistillata]|uniref:Tyrosine kinase receptor Cad96Ca n=1 Tax=Stylophora pistillata TaxID=50429 RepID=A0A2B4S2T2_STYPI|nr:Tyrosine kinase receptor Cad96Ca [Stylophora pistillata]